MAIERLPYGDPEPPRVLRVESRLGLDDGSTVPLTSWHPAGSPRAIVIGSHAYGDFRLGLTEAAQRLAARGCLVHAFDQRGFGETASRGRWPGGRRLVRDLRCAARQLRDPSRPLFLLGESLGASVTLAATQGPRAIPVDGQILVEPALWNGRRWVQLWWLVFRSIERFHPDLRSAVILGGDDRLLPAARQRLDHDPRTFPEVTVGSCRGLLRLARVASWAGLRTTVPTLLIFGAARGSAVPLRCFHVAEKEMATVATSIRYPGAPHLILQAQGLDRVVADMVAWMRGRDLPSPESHGLVRIDGPRPGHPPARRIAQGTAPTQAPLRRLLSITASMNFTPTTPS